MRARYRNWVEGLNQDWCISRQRYFGVPFPVWYPLDAAGEPQYQRPILAPVDRLPVDPLEEAPPGYDEAQRAQPGGFIGEPDVQDTWATSSLTPQIVTGWELAPERHAQLFPMDVARSRTRSSAPGPFTPSPKPGCITATCRGTM